MCHIVYWDVHRWESAGPFVLLQGAIHVSRAPGRLDVMGGIADYSGSLVLEMPVAQACHVAAQIHPSGAQISLWRHIEERHVSKRICPTL